MALGMYRKWLTLEGAVFVVGKVRRIFMTAIGATNTKSRRVHCGSLHREAGREIRSAKLANTGASIGRRRIVRSGGELRSSLYNPHGHS